MDHALPNQRGGPQRDCNFLAKEPTRMRQKSMLHRALRRRLFDFGKVDDEVARAKGSNAQALAVYRPSVLRAAGDVEDSLTVLVRANQALSLKQGRPAAPRNPVPNRKTPI